MRAAAASAHRPAPCPLCTHSLYHRTAVRLRPLLARFCPLGLGFRRRVLPLFRHSRRRFMALIAVLCLMMTILTLVTSSPPLGAILGSGRWGSSKPVCTLRCPYLEPGDTTWRPRALPIVHACLTSATVPVACSPNNSHSQLLRQPPISFLKNYLNPCWYESVSAADSEDWNPYSENLFACFSHGAVSSFKAMIEKGRRTSDSPRKRLRCLPHFYIAGMPKCGSTDLFRKVMLHPDVVKPPMKEPHWWSKNRFGQRLNYSTSIPWYDYVDLFDKAARQIESRHKRLSDVSAVGNILLDSEQDNVSKVDYHPVVTLDASASTFWNNDEWWRLPENCGRTEPLFTNAHYIRRLTPQARIIVILRNPTERLYSDYLYFTKHNKSVSAFHQDVLLSIEKLKNCTAQRSLRACIYNKRVAGGKAKVRLRIGVYHVYLSEWLKLFPREQLLVLRTEDYSRRLRQTTRQMYSFLGLRPLTTKEEKKVMMLPIANTRRQVDRNLGAMLAETRHILQDFYRPHNQRLAQLMLDRRFLWEDTRELAHQEDLATGPQDVDASFTEQLTGAPDGRTDGEGDSRLEDLEDDEGDTVMEREGSHLPHNVGRTDIISDKDYNDGYGYSFSVRGDNDVTDYAEEDEEDDMEDEEDDMEDEEDLKDQDDDVDDEDVDGYKDDDYDYDND